MPQKRVTVGGGRNTMPRPGTDLPDITDARSLMARMKFYNLLGHGAMYRGEHKVFLVPENTWILFVTRAGIPADKRKSGVLRRVLDNFYFQREGESIAQWHERVYTGMQDGTLFREILYSRESPDKFSIYEPGDLIQDLTIQFENRSWPFMRLGVWKCPMPTTVKDYLNTINNTATLASYDENLRRILGVEFPALLANETFAPHHSGIRKILAYIAKLSDITYEEQVRFDEDPEIIAALEVPEIKDPFKRAYAIFGQAAYSNTRGDPQDHFFGLDTNIATYSPSIFNGSRTAPDSLKSTLYELLNEKRFIAPVESPGVRRRGIMPPVAPAKSEDKLLITPEYRFIVVDACRSIEDLSIPKALYAGRAALTRRLSIAARATEGEVCYNTLLQMTKSKFEDLIRNRGRGLNQSSALVKLVRGDLVSLPEFEESVTAKGRLRNVASRGFRLGQEVYVVGEDGLGREGIIVAPGIQLSGTGKLQYSVGFDEGDALVPAEDVFESRNAYDMIVLERAIEQAQSNIALRELEAEVEARRAERIATKVTEKRLTKQKELWDQRYRNTVKDRFGDRFGTMLTYQPSQAQLLFTRVEKAGIPKNDMVYVNQKYVSRNGTVGYVASKGSTKRFYNLTNLDTREERARYTTLKESIADESKRFEKGTIVKIKDVPGGGAFLNGKIGIVLDIYEGGQPPKTLYRVQVKMDATPTSPETVKAFPVKPENLERAPDGTVVRMPPINAAYLSTKYDALALSPEQEAAILAEATAEVNAENNAARPAAEGGKRRTRRHKKKKSKTKKSV